MRGTSHQERSCRDCGHFLDDPQALEAEFAGLQALSSAYGSTRGQAGICLVDDTFRNPGPACPEFTERPAPATRVPVPTLPRTVGPWRFRARPDGPISGTAGVSLGSPTCNENVTIPDMRESGEGSRRG
jgi:hypothetical protein